MRFLIALITSIAVIAVSSTFYYGAKSIHDLLSENKQLKSAITNLTHEEQIGYAKVLKQERNDDGLLMTTLRFVETARGDKNKVVLQKECTIQGDVVYFDALIVTFPSDLVMDGKKRSLYLWRRIYGEYMSPEEGFPIEEKGEAPERYKGLLKDLKQQDQRTFWDAVWDLSNDPEALSENGIQAVYGNAVYKKLQPGLIYVFKISETGRVYPETVPDM